MVCWTWCQDVLDNVSQYIGCHDQQTEKGKEKEQKAYAAMLNIIFYEEKLGRDIG